jgi:hypothetical protein
MGRGSKSKKSKKEYRQQPFQQPYAAQPQPQQQVVYYQQPQPMQYAPGPMGGSVPVQQQLPHYLPPPQQQQPSQEVDGESSDSSASTSSSSGRHRKRSKRCASRQNNKGIHAALANSSGMIWQLPKVRLQELVESVDSTYDAMSTSGLSSVSLAALLWLRSGVRPDTKTTFCRANNYKELAKKFVKSAERHEASNSQLHHRELTAALTHPLADSTIMRVAENHGFDMAWATKKGKPSTKAPLLGQTTLSLQKQMELKFTAGDPGAQDMMRMFTQAFPLRRFV